MSIVISNAYALAASADVNAARPVAGYQSVVAFGNVSADTEIVTNPATNLANPDTSSIWIGASTIEQYITSLFTSSDQIDYAGIARHNFGTSAIPVTVEGLPPGGDPEVNGDWIELVGEQLLANDNAAMFRFVPTYLIGLRLRLGAAATPPQAAVFKVGSLLVLIKGLPKNHTPIVFGSYQETARPRAQSGDYLGAVILTGGQRSHIETTGMTPNWYRTYFEPFRQHLLAGGTFFWAWSPQLHPSEVGYCWATESPQPQTAQTNGVMDISFPIEGVLT